MSQNYVHIGNLNPYIVPKNTCFPVWQNLNDLILLNLDVEYYHLGWKPDDMQG